jgi:hypothetical protein
MGIDMAKKLFFFALILLLAACSTTGSAPVPTPSTEQVGQEDVAVYAAVVKSLYDSPSYVLIATTSTDSTGIDNTGQTLDYVLQNLHDVAPETEASFRARNAEVALLRPDLELGAPYNLLSRDDMSAIFGQNQDGWQVFYERFPDAPGITTVSRAGFNDTFDQALVYIGTQSHYLAGAGYYLLLKKVSGAWVIDQQVMTWVS